jgi:hypothetical protein
MLTLDSERPSQSGRNMLESVDDLYRNRWTVCAGISGRISSESVDGMVRITQPSATMDSNYISITQMILTAYLF